MTLSLHGIGVSRGVAIGRAHILHRGLPEVTEVRLDEDQIPAEVERFRAALAAAKQHLRETRERIPRSAAADIAAFIDTHVLMLEDSTLSAIPIGIIQSRRCNAEWALKLQRDALAKVFDEMDDPYLRTRKDDIDHVVGSIQRILLSRNDARGDLSEANLHGRIVVADDLSPADTVLLQHQGVLAFVTEHGGPLSHTAILARNLRIPAVVGVHHARRYLNENETLVVEGDQGQIIAGADSRTIDHYRQRQEDEARYIAGLSRLKGRPTTTRDGHKIHLRANIELPEDLEGVNQVEAEGVGLYRTEFLYMNRSSLPSEEEHLDAYRKVVEAMEGRPVTIRTLDLGADKQTQHGPDRTVCTNPALGLRAIRLCLKEPNLFMPQLRALLRASAYGTIRIMLPMLSNIQELNQALKLLQRAKDELRAEGKDFYPNVAVGGMIEVPAAAVTAHLFARQLDFMSIGTNDLIQYTLAIDRVDDEVAYLYDPLHPAVLRLIHMTITAGREAGIPVAMCGEMAGDPRYTRLLLGLGMNELSMHPSTLLDVKQRVTESHMGEVVQAATNVLRAATAEEAAELIERMNED